MGNCLKTEVSDDESLLGESDQETNGEVQRNRAERSSGQSGQSGRRRDRRRRTRVRGYMAPNVLSIPDPTHYFNLGRNRQLNSMSEGEQIAVAQRLGMIQYLPTAIWNIADAQKIRECAICFEDFEDGVEIRYLPCCHFYHSKCVDDWLIRSFTCPSCMEPVELGLQASMQQNES
jgi:E3 ubiquitin-protein ligase RNF11